MPPSVAGAFTISGNDLVDDLGHSVAEKGGLIFGENISHHDESVPAEQLHGPIDFVMLEDFEITDTAVEAQIVAEGDHVRRVSILPDPAELRMRSSWVRHQRYSSVEAQRLRCAILPESYWSLG